MTNLTDYERWNGTLKFLAGMLDGNEATELVKVIAGDAPRKMYSMAEMLADLEPNTELDLQEYRIIGDLTLDIFLAGECIDENNDVDTEDELINEIQLAYRKINYAFTIS